MKHLHHFALQLLLGLVYFLPCFNASFNLLLSREETRSLLGLGAEVKYVADNKLNNYALRFIVPVPVNVSKLNFTWFSSEKIPQLKYKISVKSQDLEALDEPKLNVSESGIVPLEKSGFQIALHCTGKKNAEVIVDISIDVFIHEAKNSTSVALKRKKICLESKTQDEVKDKKSKIWKAAEKAKKVTRKNKKKFTKATKEIIEKIGKQNKTDDNLVLQISKILENDHSIKSQRKEEDFDVDKKDDIFEKNIVFIIIGSTCLLLVLMLMSMFICYYRSKKSHQSVVVRETSNVPNTNTQSQTLLRIETPNVASSCGNVSVGTVGNSTLRKNPSIVTASTEIRPNNIKQQIVSISIPADRIGLQDIMHEGTFGQVICGTANIDNKIDNIFVKTVNGQASPNQVKILLREGLQLYGLAHPNIQKIKAVCVDDPCRPLLIYDYFPQENLKAFLHKCNFSTEGHSYTLNTQDIVAMAIQISQAMIYLHKKKIVHKDLATRNCVVDDRLMIRVTDTALSRDLFPEDYHCLVDCENRPIKWLALESLCFKIFTPSSDVWQFGVTLWELMTLGSQPYSEVDPFDMEYFLKNHNRLFRPTACPDDLYAAMFNCWYENPVDRPTFAKLLEFLQDFYKTLNRFI